MTIKVRYTCHGCGLVDRVLELEARGDVEPLKSWLDKLSAAIARSHTQASPGCTSHVCDIKIPLTGTDRRPRAAGHVGRAG
jgi:hypothetical protein